MTPYRVFIASEEADVTGPKHSAGRGGNEKAFAQEARAEGINCVGRGPHPGDALLRGRELARGAKRARAQGYVLPVPPRVVRPQGQPAVAA